MKQTVLLKSNASGITLVLDKNIPFEQLLEDTISVFMDNADFFQNSRFAIAFTGRELTEAQEVAMVMAINERTNAKVIRLISNDEELEQHFLLQQLQYDQIVSNNTGKFHRGTLNDKDVLEVDTSVVIIGDVLQGAKVVSKGNVIVLGRLEGNVFAGAGGNEESIIAALTMDPDKIRIADCSYTTEQKKLFGNKNKKLKQPQVASIKRGRIEVSPLIS